MEIVNNFKRKSRSKMIMLPILVTTTLYTFTGGVEALDESQNSTSYYTNSNGITVTEKEYDVINEYYGNGYFDNMSLEDYQWLSDLDINNREIEIKTVYDNPIQTLSTEHTTGSKKISIMKSCSTDCIIVTTATWLVNPTIRSYDVIGARFTNTSLVNDTISTRLRSSSGYQYSYNIKEYSSGFGVSIKLPANVTSIVIDQKFTVYSGGTVFTSYQHATKSISLATSQLFTLGSNGYGNVFNFYGDALNVFDQMKGVSISV